MLSEKPVIWGVRPRFWASERAMNTRCCLQRADTQLLAEHFETCKRCHIYANENYAAIDPHPTGDREDNPFIYYAEIGYNWVAYVVIALLVGLALLETIGRRRDGVGWRIHHGSFWWRRSRRGRDRVS